MPEESHLDEMRSAIRGDFERLAERRGEQELMRVSEREPEPEPQVSEREYDDDSEPGQPQRSWLARLFAPP